MDITPEYHQMLVRFFKLLTQLNPQPYQIILAECELQMCEIYEK